MEVMVVPAIVAADSKGMMGESTDGCSPNLMSPGFTIRGFVSRMRKQDIRKTWPFSESLLQRYLAEGKSLPHLDVPASLSSARNGNDETAVGGAGEAGAGSSETREQPELEGELDEATVEAEKAQDVTGNGLGIGCGDDREGQHVEEQQQQELECSEQQQESENDDQEQALEALQQLRAADSRKNPETRYRSGQDIDQNAEVLTGIRATVEDKASDTGGRGKPASTQVDVCINGLNQQAAANEAVDQQEGQQQNVCPVCTSFTSHSVTALNAHMDACLSSATADKNLRLRSKASKVPKMRSITDIIAADPSPSPKQSDAAKQADPMVRERRAPNNVVLVSEKGVPEPLRNLRSRSRGSGSLPSPKMETERSTRRKRREMSAQKSGDWSDRRKRHYSAGNSMEATSSWTPSISSGTYGHSKDTVVEKSSAEQGEKPSESHGSATCIGPLQPVQEAEVDLSSKDKELEKAEISSCTGSAANTQDPQAQQPLPELPAPSEAERVLEATRCSSPPPPPAVAHEQVASLDIDATNNQQQQQPPQQLAPEAGPQNPTAPVQDVPEISQHQCSQRPVANVPQLPRPVIPVYDSVISSLRSSSIVDSVTGYRQFSSTWKAAVVMATLGASLVQGTSSPPPSASINVINKNEVSALHGASRSFCTTASDSICMSLQEKVDCLHHDGIDFKAAAERPSLPLQQPYGSSDKGMYVTQAGTGSRVSLDRSRFTSQALVHNGEQVQIISAGQMKTPAMSWMVSSSERAPVIDVDQDSPHRAAGPDGKVEKSVLRLLGQNVMVTESTATASACPIQRDTAYANKGSFAYPGPPVSNKDCGGHHGPCCCARAPVVEPLSYSVAKNLPPSGKSSCLTQIPLGGGTWRLLPNGFINQVGGQHVSFQTAGAGAASAIPKSHLVRANACCPHKSCVPGVSRTFEQQDRTKQAGELPPWLLAAKKQKEAECAANIIVIDDDEPEEKACFSTVSTSMSADVQCTGERLVRTGSHALSACNIPQSRKRDAGEWSCQQGEKTAKLTSGDSPSTSRLAIPVLVPTWTITTSSSQAAAAAAASKRGPTTAQTYKPRFTMMRAYMHGGNLNEAGQLMGGVVSSSPHHHHHHQHYQRSMLGVGNTLVQSNWIYQAQHSGGSSSNSRVLHSGDLNLSGPHQQQQHQDPQQQQQQLVFGGKDCHLIELDTGEFILMNGHIEAEQQQQHGSLGCPQVDVPSSSSSGPAGAPPAASFKSAPTTVFRDGSGRNYVVCNEQDRRLAAAAAAEQFLVAPILQPGNIVIGDGGQAQVIPVYHAAAPSRGYLSAAAATTGGSKPMVAPALNLHLGPPLPINTSSALAFLRPDLLEMNPYSIWSQQQQQEPRSITSNSGPPSPGELDFAIFQQHHQDSVSPWAMDYRDPAVGDEHLDFDLSPLLQEHFQEQPQDDEDDEEEQVDELGAGGGSDQEWSPSQQQQEPSKHQSAPSTSTAVGDPSELGPEAKLQQQQQQQPSSGSIGEPASPFFDCNVCLDAASEPVVTACGHLFCWPCLYQWLHLHSHESECPVCKGAVVDEEIIPIYGRGGGDGRTGKPASETTTTTMQQPGVPPRPRARRVESTRQHLRRRPQPLVPPAAGDGGMLTEMLRWRRAVRFMQENVDRLFAARGAAAPNVAPPPSLPRRRRLPERRGGFMAEEALLAAIHERAGSGTGAAAEALMMEQLQHPWQAAVSAVPHILPPQAYIDLARDPPPPPLFDPYAYQIGLRRMPERFPT